MKRALALLFGLAAIAAGLPSLPASAATSTFCLQIGTSTACGVTPPPTAAPTSVPTATPTPTAAPTSSGASAPPFAATNAYPNASYKPYASTSVWNQAGAVAASPDPNSTTWNTYYQANFPYFTSLEFGYTSQTNQFQHPIYFGNSSDPVWTISCSAGYGNCSGSWHAPSYITQAGGSDAHMAIIDSTQGNQELDLYGVTAINRTTHVITASNGDQNGNIITGDGLYNEQTHGGAWLWAGVLRAQEIIAADQTGADIGHALFIVAPCTSTTEVFPSLTGTGTDTECTSNQGAPYGGWLRLNMTDAAITATGAPLYAQAIMRTLRVHGGFIMDTNGNSQFSIQTEADPMYSAAGYSDPNCPTNGAPCTALTAWANKNYPSLWNGSRYSINIGQYVPAGAWQWIDNPPGS